MAFFCFCVCGLGEACGGELGQGPGLSAAEGRRAGSVKVLGDVMFVFCECLYANIHSNNRMMDTIDMTVYSSWHNLAGY